MELSVLLMKGGSSSKLEMQSVAQMTEPRRLPRLFRRQVAIRVEDVDEKVQDGVEHYFKRLIWVLSFPCHPLISSSPDQQVTRYLLRLRRPSRCLGRQPRLQPCRSRYQ